jgi:hypothetical protein
MAIAHSIYSFNPGITSVGLARALEHVVREDKLDMTIQVDSMQLPSMIGAAMVFAVRITPSASDEECDFPFMTRVKVIYKLLADGLPHHTPNAALTIEGAPELTPFTTANIEKYARMSKTSVDFKARVFNTMTVTIKASERVGI